MSATLRIQDFQNKYGATDIHTTRTTSASLVAYQQTLKKTTDTFQSDTPGFEIVITALETGDYSQLSELATAATKYDAMAQTLQKLTVPVGVAQYHLDIINGLSGMAKSFTYLEQLDTDSLYSISGIVVYKASVLLYSNATTNLNDYLTRYGILNT